MKCLKHFAALLAMICISSSVSFAQDDLDQLLSEHIGDGKKLIKGYVAPLMTSVSTGLNSGWYNTAKPHKVAGFDITVTVSALSIPKDEVFYDVNKLNLQHISMDPSSPDYTTEGALAPTIFGPEDREPIYRSDTEPGVTFNGPGGIDLEKNIGRNMMPVPMAQLGFGLPKGTEIKIRFVPSLDFGDQSQFNMFGIGVMHDVKQWIPGIKMLPFDLSGFVGYTKMKLEAQFDEEANTENSHGLFELSGVTVQGVISKKISVLTVYGGLGYNMSGSKLHVLGKYDFNEDGDYSDESEVDPMKLDFAASGPRMTAGFRLKLAVLTLHADYTVQKYNALTVGLGISVR